MSIDIDALTDSLREITIGVSQTPGTGDFDVTDGVLPGFFSPGDSNHGLKDGTEVRYHRYYKDLSTVGRELGKAVYHAGSGELRDKTVLMSSESNGTDPVTWTSDDTLVVIGVPREVMLMAARIHTQLGPNDPLLFTYTGRSNSLTTPTVDDTYTLDFSPWLSHWTTPQTAADFDPADAEWQPINMLVQRGSQSNTGDLPYVGVPLRYYTPGGGILTGDFYQDSVPTATDADQLWFDTDSDDGNGNPLVYISTQAGDNEITAGEWELTSDANWHANSNMFYLAAGYISMMMGRKGRLVCAAKIMNIDDADGWVWNTAATNGVAAALKTQLDLAIAADADLTAAGITHPHFHFMSGMTGGVGSWTTAEYAIIQDDIIKAFYDPDRWDICKPGFTRTSLLEGIPGPSGKDGNPNFRGHAVAAEMNRDNVTAISTDGLTVYEHTYDALHYNEFGGRILTQRIVNSIAQCSSSGSVISSGAIQVTPVKVAPSFYVCAGLADSDTPPAGTAQQRFNTARTEWLISKAWQNQGEPIAYNNSLQYSLLRGLRPNPAADPATVNISGATWNFDVGGPIEDRGDHFAVPVSNLSYTSNTGIKVVVITGWDGWYGVPTLESRPTLRFSVPDMALDQAINTHVAGSAMTEYYGRPVVGEAGRMARLGPEMFFVALPIVTDSDTANQVIFILQFEDFKVTDQVIFLEVRIVGENAADATDTFSETLRQSWRWTGSAWAATAAVNRSTHEAGGPTCNLDAVADAGVQRIKLRTNGINGQDWLLNSYVRAIPHLQAA